jgi:proline iminopeptidase
MILRGIFLGTRREVDWFLNGMGTFFPEAWRSFIGLLPQAERRDPLPGYYRRLIDTDPSVHYPAAHAWSRYEAACSNLIPRLDDGSAGNGRDTSALAIARIEAHYFMNNAFLQTGELLAGVDRIRGIPATIVQGRYDMVCPIATADRLVHAWPEASYVVVPDAGHSAMEPGIRGALVRATEAMKTRLFI